MAIGDDSFIREVNEDIRQENIGRLWRLLKPFIFGGAAALILIIIGFQLFSAYQAHKAQALGDSYALALKEALPPAPAKTAYEALTAVEKSGFGGYPMLADFRKAGLLAQMGDNKAAVAAYDAFAANGHWPRIWRDMALIRAAYLLADSGSFKAVEQRVGGLANDVSPWRLAAREALGLSAWKAGQLSAAAYYFNRNAGDQEGQALGFSARAMLMISLIGAQAEHERQAAPAEAAPAASPPAPALAPPATSAPAASPLAPALAPPEAAPPAASAPAKPEK